MLFNYAFPILRYDNGDTAVATRKEKNGRYRLYLDELYGRRSDLIYDCEGKAITPYIITNNLWDIEGVKQYRFIQEDVKDYTIWLNGDPQKMNQEEILGRIRPYLGEEARTLLALRSSLRCCFSNFLPCFFFSNSLLLNEIAINYMIKMCLFQAFAAVAARRRICSVPRCCWRESVFEQKKSVLKAESAMEEQMYGCEELPAGQPVLCDVTLADPAGERRTLPYPDKELTRLGIDEGSMVVLTADGTLKKA